MKNIITTILFIFISLPALASINFNGTSQYMSAASINLGLNTGTEMSVCTWFQNISAGSDGIAVVKVTDPTGGWETFFLELDNVTPAIGFAIANKASNKFPYMEATATINNGRHFACATWKRNAGTSADFKIYLDAVSKTIDSYTANSYDNTYTLEDSSGALSIGARKFDTVDSYVGGKISDVAVWNKQLTAAEITTLYNSGYTRPCDQISSTVQNASLKAYFPMDDIASGTVATTLTNLGSVSVSETQTNSPTWSTFLTCKNSQINNGKLNNAKIYGGSQ